MLKNGKNYYEILGVTPDIETAQLKAVYRRLARKFHPDINPDGEKMFKDITEAYEVLCDETKRRQYDTLNGFFKSAKKPENSGETYRKTFRKATESSFQTKSSSKTSKHQDEIKFKSSTKDEKFFTEMINDIIDGFSKTSKKKRAKKEEKPVNGADIYTDVSISLKESISGTHKIVNVMQTCVCPKCRGRKFINDSKCRECEGKGEIITHQKINVTIPAKVKDGAKLRLPGEGKKGINGGKNGDLYLKITILPDSFFSVDGNDLTCEVPISPFEAVLGGDIEIPSLNGGNVLLTLPEKTKSGQVFRISGKGLKKNNLVGDIIVTVRIQIPDEISDEEINLYRKLKNLSGKNLRENLI